MLKQTTESVFQELVKRRGDLVLSGEKQREILQAAKNVRSVDYLSAWSITSGLGRAEIVRTRPNWIFILTGIGIYSELLPGVAGAKPPCCVFKFEHLPFTKSFKNKTDPSLMDTVPARLVLGCEGNDPIMSDYFHFEEYRNEYFILPERTIIETEIKPYIRMDGTFESYNRGTILYTGLEVSREVFQNG